MPFNNAVDASESGYQSITSAGAWHGRTFQAGAGISLTNADGTAGNTTITATGMVPDPFGTIYLVDDFIQTVQSGTLQGDTSWILNNSTSNARGNSNHMGIVAVGQSGGGAGSIIKGETTGAGGNSPLILGQGVLTLEFLVNIPTTNAASTFIGLTGSNPNAEPTDGVYFFYSSGTNSGQWVGKTANASSRSSANSANAVVGGTWQRLKIVVNAAATSVSFYVNGVEITNSPLAANIPTSTLSPFMGVTNAANNTCQLDLFVMSYVLTTPR